jgi:hypothetical protein
MAASPRGPRELTDATSTILVDERASRKTSPSRREIAGNNVAAPSSRPVLDGLAFRQPEIQTGLLLASIPVKCVNFGCMTLSRGTGICRLPPLPVGHAFEATSNLLVCTTWRLNRPINNHKPSRFQTLAVRSGIRDTIWKCRCVGALGSTPLGLEQVGCECEDWGSHEVGTYCERCDSVLREDETGLGWVVVLRDVDKQGL